MYPFDLDGPGFLAFFAVAAVVAAAASFALRARIVRAGPPGASEGPHDLAKRLHPTEVAFLLGGLDRSIEAAVGGLHHRGRIAVADGRLHDAVAVTEASGDRRLSAVERYVLARLPATMDALCLEARDSHVEVELAAKLEEEQLLVANRRRATLIVALPAIAWLALGGIRLIAGSARGAPIEILFAMLASGGVLAYSLARAPRLTALGRSVVAELETAFHGLGATAHAAPEQLSPREMSLAYAIFGHVVAATALAALLPSYHGAVLAAKSATAASGTSCAAGVADCGGGDISCGGGGDGGGGCGGCGGGCS